MSQPEPPEAAQLLPAVQTAELSAHNIVSRQEADRLPHVVADEGHQLQGLGEGPQ